MTVGSDGAYAPATIGGLPAIEWFAITARLNTERGRQLLRPAYGLDAAAVVDRTPATVQRGIRSALSDLEDVDIAAIDVEVDGDGRTTVTIRAGT